MNFDGLDLKSGIYKIQNTITNKLYIGRASNLRKRFISHRSLLRVGKHSNSYLQHAWNKYGERNFVFEIMELTENNPKILAKKERDHYLSYEKAMLYNIAEPDGIGGSFYLPGHDYGAKAVCQVCPRTGTVLRTFASISEAGTTLGLSITHISAACKGKRVKTLGGFIWCLLGDIDKIKEKPHREKTHKRRVNQIDVNTNEIINTFESTEDARRATGIRHISEVCRKDYGFKTAGGWKWEFADLVRFELVLP